MREILFRAYDKTMKRYKPFDGMHDTMTISREGKVEYYNLQNGSGCDEYILEQFTGLLDKNGKKIFEGDIVKYAEGIHHWSDAYETPTLVEYECGGFYPFAGEGEYAMSNEYAIIIGNIHDNSELLEA